MQSNAFVLQILQGPARHRPRASKILQDKGISAPSARGSSASFLSSLRFVLQNNTITDFCGIADGVSFLRGILS